MNEIINRVMRSARTTSISNLSPTELRNKVGGYVELLSSAGKHDPEELIHLGIAYPMTSLTGRTLGTRVARRAGTPTSQERVEPYSRQRICAATKGGRTLAWVGLPRTAARGNGCGTRGASSRITPSAQPRGPQDSTDLRRRFRPSPAPSCAAELLVA
jgi:hypothetical protein